MEQPNYAQGEDYGGPLAKHSEYRPGDQVSYLDEHGQRVTGDVLHVSDGPGGQFYTLLAENDWPETVPARQIIIE